MEPNIDLVRYRCLILLKVLKNNGFETNVYEHKGSKLVDFYIHKSNLILTLVFSYFDIMFNSDHLTNFINAVKHEFNSEFQGG